MLQGRANRFSLSNRSVQGGPVGMEMCRLPVHTYVHVCTIIECTWQYILGPAGPFGLAPPRSSMQHWCSNGWMCSLDHVLFLQCTCTPWYCYVHSTSTSPIPGPSSPEVMPSVSPAALRPPRLQRLGTALSGSALQTQDFNVNTTFEVKTRRHAVGGLVGGCARRPSVRRRAGVEIKLRQGAPLSGV